MSWREKEPLSLKIDFEQLVWIHLQKCATAFDAPEFSSRETHSKYGGTASSSGKVTLTRYEDAVLATDALILPEWVEKDNATWPEREAEYWGKMAKYEKVHKEYLTMLNEWANNGRDPMKHPSQPLPPEEVKPFSVQRAEAWLPEIQEWQPFKLHAAIIQLLHRRDFFKDKQQMQVIEGTMEQAEDKDQSPTSPSIQPTAGENAKSTLQSLPAS